MRIYTTGTSTGYFVDDDVKPTEASGGGILIDSWKLHSILGRIGMFKPYIVDRK